MTSSRTPITTPKLLPNDLKNQISIATEHSVLMCVLSMEHLDHLSALFGGIVAASNANPNPNTVSLELAKLGLVLADEFHNLMDCYREESQIKLGTLGKEQA